MCEVLLKNAPLLKELESEHYDVGISELAAVAAFPVFHRIGVGTKLATTPTGMNAWMSHHFGVPTFPSWSTNFLAPSLDGPHMGFVDRAKSFYLVLADVLFGREFMANMADPLIQQYFGPDFPSFMQLIRNVSLLFVNSNEFFELPQLGSAKIIHIGGVVDTKSKKLSPRFQSIVNNSTAGVVLMSFGALADTRSMPMTMKRAFLGAFAHFPTYDFVWKYHNYQELNDSEEMALIANATPNVHLFEWVEQKALLRHPKLKAFVTHCGHNSLQEAVEAGVPVVGAPLFGDQLYNAALMRVKKVGVHMDITKAHDDAVIGEALRDVLENEM
jgi:glucuronosyltransferase